jgi:DNA invertase Pin-like site-specific DNA recombinase
VKLGYMRTSTTGQSTDSQEDDLLAAGVALKDIYRDKLSGKDTKRPGLKECLRSLREGDTLVITRLSRLSRSVGDLRAVLADLTARGITLEVIHQPEISTNTATGRFMLTVLSAVDELQREIIVENTREGLAAARARGHKGGRPAGLDARKVQLARRMRAEGSSVAQIARDLKVGRATVYRHLNEGQPSKG